MPAHRVHITRVGNVLINDCQIGLVLAFNEVAGRAPVGEDLAAEAVQDHAADFARPQREEALSYAILAFQSAEESLFLRRLLATVEHLVLLEGELD